MDRIADEVTRLDNDETLEPIVKLSDLLKTAHIVFVDDARTFDLEKYIDECHDRGDNNG